VTFIADLADFRKNKSGVFAGSFKMPDRASLRQDKAVREGGFYPDGPQNSP